jgi:hypothetical protein
MTAEPHIDPLLKQWATDRQIEYIDAINFHGGCKAAAAALGVGTRALQHGLASVKRKAAIAGYAPEHDMTRPVPDGFTVKGVSTYYNKEGKPTGQWVKSQADNERREQLIRAAVEGMISDQPRLAPLPAPAQTIGSLCNLYTMTDCHMGMLAWHREGGDDWDIKIAERTLVGCFEQMVASSPAAKVGIVNQLGDFLHQDSIMPLTPTSGHVLDSDSRFEKIVEATYRTLRRLVDIALLRHEKVVVLLAEGNHDISSSIWQRVGFRALYESEPRVDVIGGPLPYTVYRHGRSMLAFHHGHLKKNDDLPLLFAAQFPEVWGLTKKRYAHTGHRHHEEVKEHSGMRVIQHPTLAARDAFAARGGWISERQATAYTYHEDFGQVGSVTVVPEMLA